MESEAEVEETLKQDESSEDMHGIVSVARRNSGIL